MALNETNNETDLGSAHDAFVKYAADGPNAEYMALEYRLGEGLRRRLSSYWQFVEDAVEGKGGFANGDYLYPYELEIENSRVSKKLLNRKDQADYDNFARDIMDAAWDQIVQSRDLITRRAPAGSTLDQFWSNVDGEGLHIIDFNEFPFRQGRCYGTGYVFMDRGQNIGAYAAQSLSDGNRPWIYSVPSENVVAWSFSPNGEITSVTLIEPTGDDVWLYTGEMRFMPPAYPHNVLTWTKESWIRYKAVPSRDEKGGITELGYQHVDGGVNTVGVVPMVPIFNDKPKPKRLIGDTEMPDVCRLSQTVFNIDSECREIERKCALFLAMPVKDAKEYADKKIETGLDNIMVYDGDAGKPEWISPDLEILSKLETRRQRIIDSAYKMGHLRAIVGAIKTQSGFHAEVEFAKTERRISRHASQLEAFEMKIAKLYQRFMGETGNVEISYPREYGVRDLERVLARAEIMFSLNLGDDVNKQAAFDLLKTFYPRMSTVELDKLTKSAVASLAQAREDAKMAALGGNVGSGTSKGPKPTGKETQPGKGQPSQSQRIQKVLDRVQFNQLGSAMKAAVDTEGS